MQGITGRTGSNAATRMLANSTPVVAGVTPGKGGQRLGGLPVFDSVVEARDALGATVSFVAVPAPFAQDACLEAIDAGLRVVVVYTEHVPVHDAVKICTFARARGTTLLGPNSAGCVTPAQVNVSDLNDANLRPGRIGIVSKSGTLTYEVIDGIVGRGFGLSTVVCLGGDPVIGTQFAEILEQFVVDPETVGIVLLGEIGGGAEFEAAAIATRIAKPMVAYVAGRWAPPGKRMGHAGALIERGNDQAAAKISALRQAGVLVVDQITEVAPAIVARVQPSTGAGSQ